MNQKEIPGTYALLGGTAAWKNAGYPMESSQSTPPAVIMDKAHEDPAHE
jgi:3-mercaptopyruvate sulfurtransferase SseA